MTDAPNRLRLHLDWIWPLMAAPVVFVVMLLLSGLVVDAAPDAVRWLSVIPFVLAFAGPAVLLVLSVRAIVRYSRAVTAADAAHRGLTREEYGVYKGSTGFQMGPVNSAGGLLAMSILLTSLLVLAGVFTVLDLVQDGRLPGSAGAPAPDPLKVGGFVLAVILTACSWRLHAVERRAQRLRVARGLPRTLR